MTESEKALQRRITAVYKEAQKDLQKKLDDYIKKFRAKDAMMRQGVADGTITRQQYDTWRSGAIFQGKAWRARVKQVTDTLANANEESLRLVRGQQLKQFAEGFNHEQYVLNQNTGMSVNFGLYDADAVGRLIREEPDLLPPKKLNKGKDGEWNQKKITGSVLQGIIQGESIDDIARRIARDTAQQNSKAMIRYARTAITGAQNAGRMETMQRAQGMGINVRKQWLATLDARTRDSHRHLDGEVVDIDEPFRSDFGKIMFPGDPSAHPGDVYNCRCTLVYVYPDYPTDPGERLDNITGEHVRGDMTYDEWAGNQKRADKSALQKKVDKAAGNKPAAEAIRDNQPNYTEEEKEGIDEYVGASYSAINTALRNDEVENYPDIKRIIENIDSAMEKSTLPEDTVCSRGTDFHELGGLWGHRPDWYEEEKHLKSIIEKDAVVKSYTSTTKGEEALPQYASKGVEIIYDVKAGTHAIDIEKVSGRNAAKAEGELLIDRGIVIRPTRIEYTADEDGFVEGKVRIYVKVINKSEVTK